MGQLIEKLQTYEALLSRLAPEVDDDDQKAIQDALLRVITCISVEHDLVNHAVATTGPIPRYDVNRIGVW